MAKLMTTAQPRTYSVAQYEAMRELFLKLHADFVTLKAENEGLKAELRTMKARKSPVRIFQEFSAPSAPDVLGAVVKEQQRRGLR